MGSVHTVDVFVQECSKEGNAAKQPVMDVPTPEEPVSARKTLFEAGEAWNQTSGKTTPSKVHLVIVSLT